MSTDTFQGADFFRSETLLNEEEIQIRDSVREWVEAEYLPRIEECHREERFPDEVIPSLAEMGLLGANIHGYECAGLDEVAYGLIMQELERGDSGLRSFVSVQGALCMYPIRTFGTEKHRETWLPAMARGDQIGCFGLTEPDFGSDPSGMRTRAERDGEDWILNGTKMWITNGTLADVAIIWARLPDGMNEEIGGFLVETDRDGFQAAKIDGKFSMRASDTAELVLDQVRVPDDQKLPGTDGLQSALSCLSQARYGIAWGVLGAAMACYDTALRYAGTREQFDQPIASFQLVQRKLANMLADITKGQLLCVQLGRLKEDDEHHHAQISMAKRDNTSAALEIARTARDVLGANGIVDEYPVIRHMMNLETVYTYEGTHDIHTLIIGEEITGIPAYT